MYISLNFTLIHSQFTLIICDLQLCPPTVCEKSTEASAETMSVDLSRSLVGRTLNAVVIVDALLLVTVAFVCETLLDRLQRIVGSLLPEKCRLQKASTTSSGMLTTFSPMKPPGGMSMRHFHSSKYEMCHFKSIDC